MSSVTAVPLRPIKQGSLFWLWFGVALVLLAAVLLAWVGTKSFVSIGFKVISEGTGPNPVATDVVLVNYTGKLENGTVFDQNPQAAMPVDGVVPGFSQALQRMKRGGHYMVIIPPQLGYGDRTQGPIPANSTLHFDVKLIDFKSQAEVMQIQQELQRLQQMPGGGAPEMPPGAVPVP